MPRKVLLIDLDDVGRELLQDAINFGWAPEIATLLSKARVFHNFWAGSWCSQFRAKVMTGFLSHAPENLMGGPLGPADPYLLPPGQCLANVLPGSKSHRGKWHLGHDVYHPRDCGFDEWSGSLANLQPGNYTDWEKTEVDSSGVATVTQTNKYATLDTAQGIIKDIRAGVDFIHGSFNAVHLPLHVPPDFPPGSNYTEGDNEHLRFQMLRCLSFFLKRTVDAAVIEGYIVIVACDNGEWRHDGGKGTAYERGVNTPLFVQGVGVLQGDDYCLIQATDLFSTIAELRGITLGTEDSVSFAHRIDDAYSAMPTREYIWTDDFAPNGEIPNESDWRRAVREQRYKLIKNKDGSEELYDLQEDADEETNILLSPEPWPDEYEVLKDLLPT